ncbi:MAG: hypothetical protein F4X65_03865 [Chloroflexi bacterium]|nr:hypothetical protein [Chloroflexota bacterium]
MNRRTTQGVTRALDKAILNVVESELAQLCSGKTAKEVAKEVYRALVAYRDLQDGVMPLYDEWEAMYYAAWYQSSHINLAYTLLNEIPPDRNPIRSGHHNLQAFDFGCGAFAALFGILLAAVDSLTEGENLPKVSIVSVDSSEPMLAIGRKIWAAFAKEINKIREYPELSAVRQAFRALEFSPIQGKGTRHWLCAFHVAYEENANKVAEYLTSKIASERPDLVIVTTHPGNKRNAFCPEQGQYIKREIRLGEDSFLLKGTFPLLTKFRSDLFDLKVKSHLPEEQEQFARIYLRNYPSAWVTNRFESQCFLNLRRISSNNDIDDLPF